MWWKKEDVYITFLKYGKKNIHNGVSFNSAAEYFKKINIEKEYHPDHNMSNFKRMFNTIFDHPDRHRPSDLPDDLSFINTESYFHLLEHDELKSARRSSFWATIFASLAIVISIFTARSSIYYSKEQINTPTTISKEQFKKIEALQVDLNPLENKVDKLTDSTESLQVDLEPLENKVDILIDRVDMAIKTFSPTRKRSWSLTNDSK